MFGELERRADAVRERDRLCRRRVEHVQDELPDRIRRQVAVLQELVERAVLARSLVAPVCFDQTQERTARKLAVTNGAGESLQQRMARDAVEHAMEVLLEVVEEREPVTGDLVTDLVDEASEAVDRGEMRSRCTAEQQRSNAEVLARGQRQDRGLVRQPSIGSGPAADRGGHSPMTWIKIFRDRDLSSSQKKTRCQRPSINDPSTIGIACDDDESRPARMCDQPFG